MNRFLLSLLVGLMTTIPALAGPTPREVLDQSVDVLNDLDKLKMKGIPAKLLEDAEAVVIVPKVIKAGFVFAGRLGHGVLFTRKEKQEWSEPVFVQLAGASVGFQAGVQSTDVFLIFRKKATLERVLAGKGKLTLGADASIAAGPVGRNAQAGTDLKLDAEILSYSRSRGLFAGVSLSGARLTNDKDNNRAFPLDQRADTAKAVTDLKMKLHVMANDAGKESSSIPTQPIPVIKP